MDELGAFWEETFRDDPGSAHVPDFVLDDVAANLPAGTALDLGCGKGDNALKLARHGWTVTGVDIAPTAVELANQAAQQEELAAEFVAADITRWQPPRTYDLVLSTYALPGGVASAAVLETAKRALAPGGRLVVAEWDRSMAGPWGFAPEELATIDELVAMMDGLEVETAAMRHIPDAFAAGDMRAAHGTWANILHLVAVKPPVGVT